LLAAPGGEPTEPKWGDVLAQRLANVAADVGSKAREQRAAAGPSLVPTVGGKKGGKKVVLLSTDQRRH
jgi:hypothetical protein